MEGKKMRYGLIDALRGFALVNMIIFHLLYDLRYTMGWKLPWLTSRWVYWWQQGICWSFVLISGFTWSLGHRQLRRGLEVFFCGLVVTAVTYLFLPQEKIFFGVLNFIGVSMMLLIPLRPFLEKRNPWAGLWVCLVIFGFCKNVAAGYLGFFGIPVISLPRAWYANYGTAILGLPFPGFYSSDYVPLIPGFFMFLAGYFLWRLICREQGKERMLGKGVPVLQWCGRHSLWLYMLHQPVLMGILMSLSALGVF
ncbi:MAG: heparan-alpha-glucosaminide N-acetyltransferase [Blautia sp.]|jgi:uncharacterized membrane protein